MAFVINNYLDFIDSMQFMNSSLDALAKDLSYSDFRRWLQEFSRYLLKLVKEKGVHRYEYMDSFKKFFEDKLPDRCECFSPLRNECINETIHMLLMFAVHLKWIQWLITVIFI